MIQRDRSHLLNPDALKTTHLLQGLVNRRARDWAEVAQRRVWAERASSA